MRGKPASGYTWLQELQFFYTPYFFAYYLFYVRIIYFNKFYVYMCNYVTYIIYY